MKKRVLALAEIKRRIAAAKTALGIKTFRHNVRTPILKEDLVALLVFDGIDEIVEKSARNATGYPQKRIMEVALEIIHLADPAVSIYQRYNDLRAVVLVDPWPVKLENGSPDGMTMLSELRAEGPSGYGLPDVEGIRLILGLSYTDDGTI